MLYYYTYLLGLGGVSLMGQILEGASSIDLTNTAKNVILELVNDKVVGNTPLWKGILFVSIW